VAALYLAQGVEAGAVRQVDVEQRRGRGLGLERRDAVCDRARLGRLVTPAAQRLTQRPADRRVVVNNQNLLFTGFQARLPGC
jgi:hypothetical protein